MFIRLFHILRDYKDYSLIKSFYYSFCSKHVDTCKGSRLFIDKRSKLYFGKDANIKIRGGNLYILTSKKDFRVPSNIYFDKKSSWDCCGGYICSASLWLRYNSKFVTGKEFVINPMTRITIERKIVFGDNNMIARNCFFIDTNSHIIFKNGKEIEKQKDIIIGNNVWFCANCTVLKGANIGNNVVIGAGTTVRDVIINDNCVFVNKIEDKVIDNTRWDY